MGVAQRDMDAGFLTLIIVLIAVGTIIQIGIQMTDSLSSNTLFEKSFEDPTSLSANNSTAGHEAEDANDDNTSTYWESVPET